MALICISIMVNNVKHHFMYLFSRGYPRIQGSRNVHTFFFNTMSEKERLLLFVTLLSPTEKQLRSYFLDIKSTAADILK